jgi:hypothetical protein
LAPAFGASIAKISELPSCFAMERKHPSFADLHLMFATLLCMNTHTASRMLGKRIVSLEAA